MDMQMTGTDGILSVPSEHVPALVAVLVIPLVCWLAVCALHALRHRGVSWATAWAHRLEQLPFDAGVAIAGSLVGAGAHLALVPTHWADERVTALLFLVDAAGFAVAAALAVGRRRLWRTISVAMLAGTAGAYAWYLVAGWESADLSGLLTSTVELGAALVLLVPAGSPASSRGRRRWLTVAALPVALASLLATSVVADASQSSTASDASSPHHHSAADDAQSSSGSGMNMPGMSAASSRAATTPLSISTSSPAGSIVWPVDMTAMAPGMQMATPDCSAQPTAAQQRAAVDLVNRTVEQAAPYKSLAAAKAAGYVPVTRSGQRVVHYINPNIARRGKVADPDSIPALVYVNTPHGAVLSAALYLDAGLNATAKPPQPAGCLTQWHVHSDLCFSGGQVVGNNTAGACAAGAVNQMTKPMMHVWLVPLDGGPLAPDPPPRSEVVAATRMPVPNPPNGVA